MLLLPQRNDRAILVLAGNRDEVFIDPGTARVLGRRRFGASLTECVKQFHVGLFAGRTGRVLVGIGGLGSLALGTTGLVLWWRSRGIRAPVLNVHRQLGLVGLVPSSILAVTGAVLIFRPYLAPVLNLLTGPMPLDIVAHSQGDPGQKAPSLEDIRQKALRIHPNARVTRLYLPEGFHGTFAARLRLPEDGNPHGNTAILFDRYSGAMILEHCSRSTSPLQKILWYAAYPWHTGDALGFPGKCLVALTGLVPSALLITGLIWWRTRKYPMRP